jgi:hypothetical protein
MGKSGMAFVTAFDHPTYAVVTFTSRQAAIAARQSLADGGAINVWKQVDDIPIAPLGKGHDLFSEGLHFIIL